MITFLSSPKAFTGIARENQMTAIRSWQRVHPEAEIFLYGGAPGTAEAAATLGVKHVAAVDCSASGIPFFEGIARHAAAAARFSTHVYLNCDIILTDHVLDAVKNVPFPSYLMIGQRIDLGEAATRRVHQDRGASALRIAFSDPESTLHPPSGIDYFIYSRGLWDELKPVVVGRGGYDSALLAFCLRREIPVIDATLMVLAIHEHHDYGHVPGAVTEVFWGKDARENRELHGIRHSPPNVADATWRMIRGKLIPTTSRGDLLRRVENRLRYRWNLRLASYGIRALWRALVGLRLYRTPRLDFADVVHSFGGERTTAAAPDHSALTVLSSQ